MGSMIGATQEDIIRVRELLGPINDLVPDAVIIDALAAEGRHGFSAWAVAAYIRLNARPRRENARP
jgi:hypothetical protein